MKKISTLAFVLRWHLAEFAIGIVLLLVSLAFFIDHIIHPASALSGISSAHEWGLLIGFAGGVVGAFFAWNAWRKASILRNGG